MGLNDSYYVIRSNMLMSSPLPFVIHVFNIVSQEESHRSLIITFDKFANAFVTKKPFKSKAKNQNLMWRHCGGYGYLIEWCYQLIGFPNKGSGAKSRFNKNESRGNKSNANVAICNSVNNSASISLTSEMYD